MHVGEYGQMLRKLFVQTGGCTTLRLFGLGGCETKTRLQRKRLPPKFINRSIMNMKARCQRLFKAKGGQIEEGGL